MKKSILIFSTSVDSTTDDVADWLFAAGHTVFRLNGNDMADSFLSFRLSNQGEACTKVKGIDFAEMDTFWFRKGQNIQIDKKYLEVDDPVALKAVHGYLFVEQSVLKESIYKAKTDSKSINYQSLFGFNKLYNLRIAQTSGLCIPETLVTKSKEEIARFKKEYKNIITKSISENVFFRYQNKSYAFYTSEISDEVLEIKNDIIFPTLVQEKIDKIHEIRVFYLCEKIYSMAIFSSEIDYRKTYKANRYQVYKLPDEVEIAIRKCMSKLRLESGMIDLIKSTGGRYVFLEINPSGQFGSMSSHCNYHLEHVFAKELIKDK